jgi:nitrous oxidase accessory protein NosD
MHSFSKFAYRPAAIASALAFAAWVALSGAAAASSVIYVAPGGSSGHSGTSCATAKYATINDGVTAASPGGKVVVCAGTYDEMVTVDKALTLNARAGATIDATGFDNGVLITHSNVSVGGFTVENATGEGILAEGSTANGIAHVKIDGNTVRHNDQGGPASSYTECQPNGEVPGDCGEGIHLMTVHDSKVVDNFVTHNSGGILLTDELGPTHDNLISGNVVIDNLFDCGITLASHNAGWDPGSQTTTPSVGGVFHNTVVRNIVRRNGLKGEGAGVLIAASFPLAAAYSNHVVNNTITGNELAGVTIHSHPGGGYINNNVVSGNTIGRNNLGGDPDAGVTRTAGIVVYSTDQPTHVVIDHNRIFNDHFGIWLSSATVTATLAHNSFVHVAIPVKNG